MAPSERIMLGGMGVGGRGKCDLNWMLPEKDVQFVAICDAKKGPPRGHQADRGRQYGNKDCRCIATCASSWPRARTLTPC